ncbi:site-specific DNA-methyltransferase [Chitinibacter sp. S2-10]|uniref:site-specific DNA-methyltransferase n=1 Tax=Chitinibacter sp. S2-10 TaxID=3373597 RepID=UPI003977A196
MENQTAQLGCSPNALAERQAELLALLRQTAPEVISDNQIDIEKLKELIGQESIAPAEHYELSWAGKAAARREIQKSTSHTLLPTANNPAIAPHMLIEGENLEVLRALQKSYHGEVKMIYIDPPYNTGNDSFVYPDDYSETLDEYLKRTGEKNEAGYLNKQSLWKKNSKESGQYHSAWLSMMYPRLYLARNLLRDDGLLFISIDDHEVANLIQICDEIFGSENFIGSMSWLKKRKGSFLSKKLVSITEWVLVYGKGQDVRLFGGVADEDESQPLIKRTNSVGVLNFPACKVKTKLKDGVYHKGSYGEGTSSVKLLNDVVVESGLIKTSFALEGPFVWGQKYLDDQLVNGAVLIVNTINFQVRAFKAPDPQSHKGLATFIDGVSLGATNEDGSEQLESLMNIEGVMSYPKPVNFVKHLVASATHWDADAIVLDFFSGSGTTAQAVMELNIEDGGNRECICIQMPELLEEDSEAYKAGYRTIADITRTRIDKVIDKLKTNFPDKTADLACAQFTLAPSNFKVWRGDVNDEAAVREQLSLFQSAEKTGHAPQAADAQTAMLAELLLKHGLGALGVHAISKPVSLAGVTVHRVLLNDDKQLWLCFEPYTAALKDEIVKAKPAQVILLNSCFVGDNADELLSNLQLELAGLDIGLTVI